VKKARKFEDRKVYFQANLSLFERKEMRVSRAIVAAAIDTRRKSDDLDRREDKFGSSKQLVRKQTKAVGKRILERTNNTVETVLYCRYRL
jgi:hypothetical protein